MQEFHEDLSHSWEYWLSFSWRCWSPLLCVQLTSIPSWFVTLFSFLTVNCYFSGNLLIALASTFVTADFFWTKVQCFMSDFFLSLFLSINAKNHKFPSLSWSVSIVDESLHSVCSSCGKLIFLEIVSVLFCLPVHVPDLLHCQPGAQICLGSVGGCSFGLLPEKYREKVVLSSSWQTKWGFQVCSKITSLKFTLLGNKALHSFSLPL